MSSCGAEAAAPRRRGRVLPGGLTTLVCGAAAVALTTMATLWSAAREQPLGALLAWTAAFFAATAAVWNRRLGPPARPRPPAHRWPLLLAVLALAVAARTAWIDELPRSLFGDESRLGMYLRTTYAEPIPTFFVMGWNSWPLIGMSVQGLFGPVLGLGTTALRLSSAFFGTLTVLMIYLLARELFQPRVALVAAFLLAVCRTALDFSRLGICHAQVPFLATFAFYFWWRGLNTGAAASYLWAGIGLGLGLYTYNAGQALPLVWLLWAALCATCRPSLLRRHGAGALLVVVGFCLAAAPWLYYVTDHFEFTATWHAWTYMARDRQVLQEILDTWRRATGAAAALDMLGNQVWRTWLGFTRIPANAYQLGYQGGGMLDRVTSVLFVGGLLLAGSRIRRGRESFVLFWWVFIAVAGGVLTRNPPAFVRLVGLLPALAILAALPVDLLLRHAGKRHRAAAAILAAVLLGGAAWENWRTYFVEFAAASADDTSELAHWVRARPAAVPVFLLGADHYLHFTHDVNVQQFAFDFPDRRLEDVGDVANFLPPRFDLSAPLLLVLAPTHASMAVTIRQLYPRAATADVRERRGDRLFFRTVEVSPAEVAELRGLSAAEFEADGRLVSERRRDPQAPGFAVAPAGRVRWTGRVYWPRWHPAELVVDTALPLDLTLGRTVRARAVPGAPTRIPVTLPRGWQTLSIEESGGGEHRLALSVGFEGRDRPLAAWDFRPDPAPQGLLGVYERYDEIVERRIDAHPGLYAQESYYGARLKVHPRTPFAVTWRGALRVDRGGRYEFEARANAPYSIELDGRLLCAMKTGVAPVGEPCSATRELTAGLHPLTARWDSGTIAEQARQVFQFLWAPPGEELHIVPPASFVPPP